MFSLDNEFACLSLKNKRLWNEPGNNPNSTPSMTLSKVPTLSEPQFSLIIIFNNNSNNKQQPLVVWRLEWGNERENAL